MENDSDVRPLCEDEEDEVVQRAKCCDRRGSCYRYLALLHMCIIGFGSCFCYDNPGALQDNISQDLGLSATKFAYLYSVYSWPNVILCFLGGFLIDRVFGIKLGTVLYALIVVIGQLVFALGGYTQSFWVMLVGRFIFGIGGESLAVAQNYYAVLWFKGKELNMVFGLQLSLSRIGSAASFLVMGRLLTFVEKSVPEYEALGSVLLLAGITCLASLISAICLAFMSLGSEPVSTDPSTSPEQTDEEVVRLTDVITFSPSFWLVCLICIAYYIAIFPFISLGKIFFERKYDLTADQANSINSFIYIVSGVASPLLGLLIDKLGLNVLFVTSSIITTILAHSALAFTLWKPLTIVFFLGLSYSLLASSLWPMIALIIPEYQLGTAYGVAQALQNTGLAGAMLIAGMIVDTSGYFMLEIFFIMSLFVALMAAFLLWMYDVKTSGILNMTTFQRGVYEKFMSKGGGGSTSRMSDSVDDIASPEVSQPRSSFSIRSRYLARLGAANNVPGHLEDHSKQFMYRNLR